MIHALLAILSCQLAGEATVRALGLPLPGPVLGMVLMVLALRLSPRLMALVTPLARGLLANLSLLFVPAGTGIVIYGERIAAEWLPLLVALFLSTFLALAVTALVLKALTHKRAKATTEAAQ